MGAELSRPLAGSDITNLREDSRRRVGSSSALDSRRQANKQQQQSGFPTSASTTALSSLGQTKGSRSSSANSKSLFSSMRRSRNNSKSTPPDSMSVMSGGDNAVESLDLPIVEWEGYVTKRGHLVRNWKMRFFTLEGNLVSYYENKVDARNRSHLKGRVNVASVKMDKVAKNGHGFDFSFETTEGKVFYCSVPTHFDQLAWVYFLEAGVDTVSMRQNNRPVYGTYRHGALPDMHTDKAYEAYRRMLGGDAAVVTELLSYFNKDLVFSSSYPKSTPFSGDYFGREGLLHFMGAFQSNVDLIEINVQECELDANGKSLIVKGTETLKSKHSGAVITQSWSHRVRFGPYGRILRFRVDVDLKSATGNWKSFGVKNPYSEMSDASIRSNRSLSISMKDFTVYNVIGKGGFGTVVNAVKKSDDELKSILRGFLQKDPTKRLGTNISDILEHPYFRGIDWDLLLKKQITPPWKPKLTSPLDVEYVDTEFTDLDVHSEVQSPTDKSAAKSKGFLSLVSSRGNREKAAPPVQDPTFKDFTYFCEDPDSLVEVTNLVSELRPPPPPPSPTPSPLLNGEDSDESDRPPEHENSMPSECEGTPLSSFVENGHLNPMPMSPNKFHEGLKKLEASMTEQFERVEVTISRERPPIKKTNGSSSSSSEEQEQDRVHVEKLVISHGPSIPTDTTATASTTSPSANSRGLSGTSDVASHEPNSPASRSHSAVSSTAVDSRPIMEAEF
ncbi:hypothetical protein PC129_g21971 [Phytophthora cactorum]|uniref:PH domain-like n=1 Tax=Phytophthora cactorum TaxID=29920 RepID=A0A8T1H4E3_9STRA|nr:hypothetical protein C6341_g25191 [Phytophthora cactorum]KAG3205709.1 hypothetical protein PC129_g21971 [Phytophthora cactorum]